MSSLTAEEFLKYIKAFNSRDFKTQHSFYHPEVELLLPAEEKEPVLKGSDGIFNHYARIFSYYNEHLIPIEIMANGRRLFFVMETLFQAANPISNGIAKRAWEPGDLGRMTVWALYDLEDGKMKKIVCNQEKFEWFGKSKSFEQALEESQSRTAPEFRI
ncbi:uncharacterized protein Z518_09441 [Rhinocladiella mackenziei CBS 650.93]|uniref:Rhinocladiella mackenziei CBS 650.93 unplaced genomic scaffold supercont1.7, whole genome shotgun sequence n=1 Tax=Rhinocladiella mackenziei CBS 650.93 TaxID=1442369 RepID=A0A0D2IYL7_9EURO|nr:uncharacterized protein Z518_09441 [Rhinocladiella mackenziei CBS 650.93]KIX01715.1 hypothetical protein Z518_09441 [Rhinocladiella mackenziei CBS 650.93]